MTRNPFGAATWVLAALVACFPALAQTYPERAVRLVVGFTPGGAADTVARALDDALSRELGQPVVIDNRPGAGSALAAEYVAKSPADGYTVLVASPASIAVNPALNPRLGYKAADLAPVTQLTRSALVLVASRASGISSVRDLIAEAKKRPGKLNYASSGVGSAPHVAARLFSRMTGTQMVHVPFRGGAPAIVSVAAGDTQLSFATPPSVLTMIRSGRVRALAVTTAERSPLMPDLPGMREAGLPEFGISFWYGLFVPADTPADVVRTLFNAANAAARSPAFAAAMAREGTQIALSRSPEAFAEFVEAEALFWARLARESALAE